MTQLSLGIVPDTPLYAGRRVIGLSERRFERAGRAYVLSGSAYFEPFSFGGCLWALSSSCFPGWRTRTRTCPHHEAWQLVDVPTIKGLPQTISELWRSRGSEWGPDGLTYEGLAVQYRDRAFVLRGPRVRFFGYENVYRGGA